VQLYLIAFAITTSGKPQLKEGVNELGTRGSDPTVRGSDAFLVPNSFTPSLTLSHGFSFLFRPIRNAEFFPMLDDDGVELLLNFPQESRWVHARKIPVDMLIHDLDER
jgi:hypothetical protein